MLQKRVSYRGSYCHKLPHILFYLLCWISLVYCKVTFNDNEDNLVGLSVLVTDATGVEKRSWENGDLSFDDIKQLKSLSQKTSSLLKFKNEFDPSALKTVEDVIKQYNEVTETLGDVIDEILADLANLHKEVNFVQSGVFSIKGGVHNVQEDVDMVQGEVDNVQIEVDNVEIKVMENQMSIGQLDLVTASTVKNLDELRDDVVGYVDKLNQNDTKIEDEIQIINGNLERIKEMPIGCIVSWVLKPQEEAGHEQTLPDGWVRCDGSVIPAPSVWEGGLTPDLNGQRRFLRGGSDEEALTLEDDQLQDHMHRDGGHTHTDSGHNHGYGEDSNDNKYPGRRYIYDNPIPGDEHGCTREKSLEFYDLDEHDYKAYVCPGGFLSSETGYASLRSTTSNIEGVDSNSRYGTETRPTNMNIIFIMRVW